MAMLKIKTDDSNLEKIRSGIRKHIQSEEFKLTWPSLLEVNPEATVGLLDYILGNSRVLGIKVPPQIMAKIATAIFHHARLAYNHIGRDMKLKTVDNGLLNVSNDEMVTPRNDVKFPRGFKLKDKFYFALELKVYDDNITSLRGERNPMLKKGDYILLTEHGVYRWVYSYRKVKKWVPEINSPKYRKNLRTTQRYIPVYCSFTPVGSKEFEEIFTAKPELFLNLMFRVHQQLKNRQGEINRIAHIVSDESDKIWKMLSVLSYR